MSIKGEKIVFVMNDYSVLGGVEKVTSNLIYSFIKYNIGVWGIISLNKSNNIPAISFPKNIHIEIENNTDNIISIILKNKITHVILQSGDIKSNAIISKKLASKNIIVYNMVHSTPYAWLKRFYIHQFLDILRFLKMEIFIKYLNKYYFNQIIKFSNRTFFVSQSACNEAKQLFPQLKDKIDYIYNISLREIDTQIDDKENMIIYAGRFDGNKRVLYMIQILSPLLSKNSNWKFIILGDGEEKEKIETYLSKLNLTNIQYLGQVSNVDEYLIKSKICVLYSYFEGLPTILLEALQYKNVIVANHGRGGYADIIQDGKNGFLVQNDIEFYEKVELLMTQEERYKKMQNNNISYYDFSERGIIEKWKKFL